jgi:hypothetical protein
MRGSIGTLQTPGLTNAEHPKTDTEKLDRLVCCCSYQPACGEADLVFRTGRGHARQHVVT